MATNLNIDERLLVEAQKLSGKRTKRETVNEALTEYIMRRKQKDILQLFGTVDFDKRYNHKQLRKKR
jgi:Arc/MetJ family transcription regulator